MPLFQDWIFALLWHLGYRHLCCSDAQRPNRSGPRCATCWVNAWWQPLPREPAARFTGFRWLLPSAAQEHRLPGQSLPGMDKAGVIQVRQPNAHCKCSLRSGHQCCLLCLSQQIQMHSSLSRWLSFYVAKPYKPWPTIWSLPTPISVGPAWKRTVRNRNTNEKDACSPSQWEIPLPCPSPCSVRSIPGEGQGMVSMDSRARLSCNSVMLGNFSVFIVCLNLRHVQVGKENRKVGKKIQENNWKFSNMFQSQLGAICTLYRRVWDGFYGMSSQPSVWFSCAFAAWDWSAVLGNWGRWSPIPHLPSPGSACAVRSTSVGTSWRKTPLCLTVPF